MPTDPTNLMGQVYDLFTSLYPNTAGGSAVLAFEKLGLPISSDMFKVNPTDNALSPALAIERLSQIANTVLVVAGDSVQHTDRTIDAQLQLLVQQSVPATPDMAASLGAAKMPAGQAFDSMALGSLEGPFTFHPAYASPTDWYDPTAAGNWTAHTIGQGTPPAATPSPQQPPRPIVLQPPMWRVMPAQAAPVLAQPITPAHPLVAAAPAPMPAARPMAMPMMRPMGAPVMAPHLAPAPVPVPHPILVPPPPAHIVSSPPSPVPTTPAPMMNITTIARTNVGIVANSTAQPVTGNALSITFEHCIVTLTRPGYPQGFMTLRDWYLPGYSKGDFSHGTGVSDAALIPLVPTGFVAIRNLSIRASWSDQDRAAAQQSASFGPFSLVGRNFDVGSGALNCPGIQIIGWFLTPLPLLPPNTDPALLPPPPPPSTLDVLTNPQVDNALVGGLTGLLGAAEELLSSSASNAPAQPPSGGGSG